MSDDLRTLAQAVVDAPADDPYAALAELEEALAVDAVTFIACTVDTARAILAAMDAADAQGYARALGEVVAFDERDPCPVCDVGDWARERAAAAARD